MWMLLLFYKEQYRIELGASLKELENVPGRIA
jgi:hypothetical protein